jgi:cytochrome c-type biogenesis protein
LKETLINLLEGSNSQWITASILGLLTAISPCPLATNITAVGFISRDLESRRRVFINGLLYATGRAVTYSLIALIIFFGADQVNLSGFIQRYGEKIIGPLLLLIGITMTGIISIKFPGVSGLSERMSRRKSFRFIDSLLLGMVFALAFCPYSGVLYFGMLIPLTLSSGSGLFLPLVFSLANGLPVILIAWILAYALSGLGGFYNKARAFELRLRLVVSILFIVTGLYYIIRIFL